MERVSRLCAVAFVAVSGLIHLQLWQSGYRGIPNIGRLFMANVVVSAALALAVLVRSNVRLNLAGVVFSAGSLVALVLSRTVGIFGFTERAWTDQAVQATTAELGAIVAFAAAVVATRVIGAAPVPARLPLRRRTPG
jgi:hypothetical protein